MDRPHFTGFKRILSAILNAVRGLKITLHRERAFQQELAVFVVVVILGWWVGRGILEKLLLILFPAQVLICELINSALEAIMDCLHPNHHPLIGYAKDAGAASVLCMILLSIFCWLMILWGHRI